jgi:hypothetical protein
METIEYFNTSEKVQVDSYPYGSLRTVAYFSLEHKKGKGFRTVFQTVNPKTGRLNAEKKSTYNPIALMYRNLQNGHIEYSIHQMNGRDDLNAVSKFLAANWDRFSDAEKTDIINEFIAWAVVDLKATCVYGGAKPEDIKQFYLPIIATVKTMLDNQTVNVWDSVKFDVEAINAAKPKDFNPFKVSTYTV